MSDTFDGDNGINGSEESKVFDCKSPKRPRTSEDFYRFCKYVLEYVKYDGEKTEEERRELAASPLGSTGSMNDGFKSDETLSETVLEEKIEISSDDESFDTVTCFCRKPFAGRPMVECSKCLKWIHISCAKLKKSNIPKVFICTMCKRRTKRRRLTKSD